MPSDDQDGRWGCGELLGSYLGRTSFQMVALLPSFRPTVMPWTPMQLGVRQCLSPKEETNPNGIGAEPYVCLLVMSHQLVWYHVDRPLSLIDS